MEGGVAADKAWHYTNTMETKHDLQNYTVPLCRNNISFCMIKCISTYPHAFPFAKGCPVVGVVAPILALQHDRGVELAWGGTGVAWIVGTACGRRHFFGTCNPMDRLISYSRGYESAVKCLSQRTEYWDRGRVDRGYCVREDTFLWDM